MTIYERIKKLLPEQYKNAPNLNKILEVLAAPFEELKIVNEDLRNVLSIDNGIGAQLDLIGDIIVQKRNGLNDIEYRKRLKFKILQNTSRGFVTDVTRALKFISEASVVVYSDNPPAAYTIYTNGTNLPADIHKIMDKLSAAGVSLIIYASDGETPLILTELITEKYNLIDDLENQFIDDLGQDVVVEVQTVSDRLQKIYNGKGMGVIETFNLTTNNGDIIITDNGQSLAVYDENQNIIDGGKLNLVYQ